MKRIAFARIMQETNALSPLATELVDFQTAHYLEGDALLHATTRGPEVPGYFKRAELAGFVSAARDRAADIEPVPILSAWASSSGPLSKLCFETLEGRLIELLRAAGPLDGMFFALHGAMGARGIADPESRLLRAARSVLGGVPIATSHDLHGNVTKAREDPPLKLRARGRTPVLATQATPVGRQTRSQIDGRPALEQCTDGDASF